MTEPNELGKALQEWWDSDACKEMQKANEEAKQRAVGKYFMLSESDKLDMVQAICYIMCKAESEDPEENIKFLHSSKGFMLES